MLNSGFNGRAKRVTNPSDPVGGFPLSLAETDFLTFERIPEDLRRSIVPLVEMTRTDDGAAAIRPIGTAFVLAELPSGRWARRRTTTSLNGRAIC